MVDSFFLLNTSYSSPALGIYAGKRPAKNLTTSRTKPGKTKTKTKSKTANASGHISHSKDVILFGAGSLATTYTALPPRDDDAAQIEAEQLWLESRKDAAKPLRRLVTPDDFLEFHSSNDDKDENLDDDDIVSEADLLREAEEELAELERIHGPLPDSFFGNADSNLNPNPNFSENPNTSFDDDELDETGNEEDLPEDSGKGVPAVMRCFDRAKIYVKAGDGGDGVVAFRREKYVPFGGPSGGNGGRGGNVYIEVDGSMNSLLPFRKTVHFRAGSGSHGQGKCQDGAKGKDAVVKVAPGTIVRDASEGSDGDVLVELTTPGQRVMVLPGGRGGRGNASFKTGRNKAPQISENGEEGAEMWLDLELKLVADVGIVGIPNAGKSTFLSAISAAQPTIANYPFTTLLPNLGVVSLDYDATMVVADLPGLLEGAHRGFGLGHEFLRHTERCHVLVHVVDGTSQQPEYEFDAVRLELDLFSPELAYKPCVVAYNKMDIPESAEHWKKFEKNMQQRGIHPLCMSAATTSGTMEVVYAAYELLKKQAASIGNNTQDDGGIINNIAEMIAKKRSAPLEDFEITYDDENKTWCVYGAGLQRFTQMTNWEYFESIRRFQHVLEACGVDKCLRERGVKEGDTVIVGQMELVWHDSNDASLLVNRGKFSRGSSKWPH
ncbi:hypothetical protein SUGI_0967570 [Cryptomeria japonica]|uniref:GTP-binding protein OBGC, chloroplastic n=1 Tax=Cryptomeria japonica TaxID=3369 RepID=UPI002414914D|nr:GTP-binding protein OBGC, chloroplastic [Cryptomeria japonica]GLJ45951.1 hypothetical protein SUGI_0967570 [Cryptomeria japonica]